MSSLGEASHVKGRPVFPGPRLVVRSSAPWPNGLATLPRGRFFPVTPAWATWTDAGSPMIPLSRPECGTVMLDPATSPLGCTD
jgi:hypothetical protein